MLNRTAGWKLATAAVLGLLAGGVCAQDRAADEARLAAMRWPIRQVLDDGARELEYERLLKMHAPALVTIKYVEKTQGSYGDFQGEKEITGVMIEPTGLVLCSNTQLGRSSRYWGRSVPTEIKILSGDDTEGLDAKFVARDTELDLAWLQIKEPGERKFPCLDLSSAPGDPVRPKLGERLLTMGVMGKYFGKKVLVTEGYVAGRTSKPRELYVSRGEMDNDPGLPVFTPRGRLVGFECLQQPDADEVTGSRSDMTTRGHGLILPVAAVAKATERAKEVLAAEQAEEAGAAGEQGAGKAPRERGPGG